MRGKRSASSERSSYCGSVFLLRQVYHSSPGIVRTKTIRTKVLIITHLLCLASFSSFMSRRLILLSTSQPRLIWSTSPCPN